MPHQTLRQTREKRKSLERLSNPEVSFSFSVEVPRALPLRDRSNKRNVSQIGKAPWEFSVHSGATV
jgi:hypothetical protein